MTSENYLIKPIDGTKPIRVLLVEDSPDDVEFTVAALKKAKVSVQLSVVEDGQKAMEFLRREGKYADAIRPDLILLDLNLPRKNGHEVLAEVRASEDLMRIPVIVLTTSDADKDILQSYELKASAYVTKPVGLQAFMDIVKKLEDFWFTVVRFPPREE